MSVSYLACNDKDHVFDIKNLLKEAQILDRSRRILKETDEAGNEVVLIPLTELAEKNEETVSLLSQYPGVLSLRQVENSATTSGSSQPVNFQTKLRISIERLLGEKDFTPETKERLLGDLPRGWDRYGDFVLLPEQTFSLEEWGSLGGELWKLVATALGCKRLGKKSKIPKEDEMRIPRVRLLLGEDPWVSHTDNGIKCSWNVTRSMFSSGNGTEKKRVAEMDSKGMVVVDLYAGIGYFTLPYLIYGKAKFVYACEWNPDAVVALRRNLIDNKVSDRCQVCEGDNAVVAPVDVADRVNLGLIPSSEKGWHVAARCLKKDSGGWLHIHENITEGQEPEWISRIKTFFSEEFARLSENTWSIEVRHIENVKSYAPRIFHMVADVECRPPRFS